VIAILLLIPLAVGITVLACVFVLVLAVAMGAAALWALRRAAAMVLGPGQDHW
jgi:hypothetical protein